MKRPREASSGTESAASAGPNDDAQERASAKATPSQTASASRATRSSKARETTADSGPSDRSQRWVPLAEVARPHGVQGELKLKVYNSDSDLLCSVAEVLIEYSDGERAMVEVKSAREIPEGILVRLKGCDTREAAEDLRGAKVMIQRSAFPPLEDGEFYACDIEGAKVVDPEGEVGIVERLVTYPTCDALLVREGTKSVEIPLVDGVVDEVDAVAGLVKLVSRGAFIPQ
ncbi:MAG: ribosome maturation factor RimM [Polyangiaceae bacterium]